MIKSVLLFALLGLAGLCAEPVAPELDLVIPVSGVESGDDVPNNLPYQMEPEQDSIVPESEGMGEDVPNNLPYQMEPEGESETMILPDSPISPEEDALLPVEPLDDTVLEIVESNLPLGLEPESSIDFQIPVDPEEDEVPNNLPYPMEPGVEAEEDVPNNLPYPMEPPGQAEDVAIIPDSPASPESDLFFSEEPVDDSIFEIVPNNLPYPMQPEGEYEYPEEDVPSNLPYEMEPPSEGMEDLIPDNILVL